MSKVLIGGTEYILVPLRSRQVVEVVLTKGEHEFGDHKPVVERGLRAVAYSVLNGGAFAGKTVEEVADIVDAKLSWKEYNAAYSEVMRVTGLDKVAEGEAPAADSTSTESAAE